MKKETGTAKKTERAHTAQAVLRTPDAKQLKITGESGKYWICGNVKFRKRNPQISVKIPTATSNEKGGK